MASSWSLLVGVSGVVRWALDCAARTHCDRTYRSSPKEGGGKRFVCVDHGLHLCADFRGPASQSRDGRLIGLQETRMMPPLDYAYETNTTRSRCAKRPAFGDENAQALNERDGNAHRRIAHTSHAILTK